MHRHNPDAQEVGRRGDRLIQAGMHGSKHAILLFVSVSPQPVLQFLEDHFLGKTGGVSLPVGGLRCIESSSYHCRDIGQPLSQTIVLLPTRDLITDVSCGVQSSYLSWGKDGRWKRIVEQIAVIHGIVNCPPRNSARSAYTYTYFQSKYKPM